MAANCYSKTVAAEMFACSWDVITAACQVTYGEEFNFMP
jgi:hypothetical protein